MQLFLVQHAKSLSKEQDPRRPISPEGRAETEHMAEQLRAAGVRVEKILHSGKLRARESAEIFAEALRPPQGTAETSGMKPNDDTAEFAAHLPASAALMLVGHLPFMEKLCALLLGCAADAVPVKFQNAGVVCLQSFPAGTWTLRWMIVPDMREEA